MKMVINKIVADGKAVKFASGEFAGSIIKAINKGFNEAGAHSDPEKRVTVAFPVRKHEQVRVCICKMVKMGILDRVGIANKWHYEINFDRIDLVALLRNPIKK